MTSIRRALALTTPTLLTAGLTACGGTSAKTQGKIDIANEDDGRLNRIEMALLEIGVVIGDARYSMSSVREMDPTTLQRARDLLNEYLRRARNFVSVATRRDVVLGNLARLGYVQGRIESAEALRVQFDRAADGRAHATDCDATRTGRDADCP